jgi:hypothetical protein
MEARGEETSRGGKSKGKGLAARPRIKGEETQKGVDRMGSTQ